MKKRKITLRLGHLKDKNTWLLRPNITKDLLKGKKTVDDIQNSSEKLKVKSYSHGAVAALLDVAQKLDIPPVINNYIESPREYMPEKPVRNNLTAGITFLLGAIGRGGNNSKKYLLVKPRYRLTEIKELYGVKRERLSSIFLKS